GFASDYVRGLWALQLLRRTVDRSFEGVDLMVMPTLRGLAPAPSDFQREVGNPAERDPQTASNCDPFNIYGIPAISIPCGFSRGGLPVGLMIAGPRFAEGKVLA